MIRQGQWRPILGAQCWDRQCARRPDRSAGIRDERFQWYPPIISTRCLSRSSRVGRGILAGPTAISIVWTRDGSALMRSFLSCLPTGASKANVERLSRAATCLSYLRQRWYRARQSRRWADSTKRCRDTRTTTCSLRLFRAGYHNEFVNERYRNGVSIRPARPIPREWRKSRMIFARKLMRDFPDDVLNVSLFLPRPGRPRDFCRRRSIEARKALRSGDEAAD